MRPPLRHILALIILTLCLNFPATSRAQNALPRYSLSPDAQSLALVTESHLRVYRQNETAPLLDIPINQRIDALSFDSDSRFLAAADETGKIQVWDVSSGQQIGSWGEGHEGSVEELRFFEGSTMLFVQFFQDFAESRILEFWSWDFGADTESQWAFIFSYNSLRSGPFVLNSDRTLMVLATYDMQNGSGLNIANLKLIDTITGETFHTFGAVRSQFSTLILNKDNILASLDQQGVVRLWDTQSRQELAPLTLPFDLVKAIRFSPDGQLLVTGGTDSKVRLWNVADGALLQVYPNQPTEIRTLQYLSDGRLIATGYLENRVLVWDVTTLEPLSFGESPS